MRRITALAVVLPVTLGVCLLAGGCPTDWLGTGAKSSGSTLKRFSSGDELLGFFRQRALESSGIGARSASTGGLDFAAAPEATGGAAGSAANGADSASAGDTSFSTTNIQEAGVDESDVFKSDGTNFYLANGRSLRVVRASPSSALAEISRVDFDDPIDSLYLYGQRVIVLLQKSPYSTYYAEGDVRMPMGVAMIWPPYYEKSATVVVAVDITDPNSPAVTARNELDGSLVSSRLTNDRLILVLAYAPTLPYTVDLLSLSALSVQDVLPMMRTADGDSLAVAPENCYYPESPAGFAITTVVTLDAGNIALQLGSVGVMANAETIYASTDAVYFTATDYDPNDNYRARTNIHKFALGDQGVASYVASGTVPGTLLNQFSLGEHQGYLRVATHTDATFANVTLIWPVVAASDNAALADAQPDSNSTGGAAAAPTDAAPAANGVYVLNQTADGKLAIVGSLAGVAPTEKLYAARFFGNRGYLVTFKQIDPLFVIDLSNPSQPTELGRLKIPGYSDYLHPFGDLLIGVGQAIGQSDWGTVVRRGVQLSLFNVSDPNNPALIQQVEIGSYQSSSEVSTTHKAFTFLPDQGLLAFPVRATAANASKVGGVEPVLDGVVCYRVSGTGFEALGNLSAVATAAGDSGWATDWGWSWEWGWRRPAFIGGTLYAVTSAGVRAADLASLADPNARTTLVLQPGPNDSTTSAGGMSDGNAGSSVPSTGSAGG